MYSKVVLILIQNSFNTSKEERVDTLGTWIRRKTELILAQCMIHNVFSNDTIRK